MSKKSKSIILQRIKNGLSKAKFKDGFSDNYTKEEIYHASNKSLIEIFEQELTKINGRFQYCLNEQEVAEKIKLLNNDKGLEPVFCSDKTLVDLLNKTGINFVSEIDHDNPVKAGISVCEYLVARFGSVLVSSAIPGARRVFSFPYTHIVIAYEDQLVMEIEDGLKGIAEKYNNKLPSQITNIAGPSRTADIEKTLILGAHGPKELIVFIIKS
ncbi:MAG: LUD domain-containing protein [Bacteroidota bacterium]